MLGVVPRVPSPEATVPITDLGNPRYVSLRTFRRTGVAVDTPVWAAADGSRLYVMTTLSTGKAKRIRNNPLVEVAACDMRGRVTGEWVPARASLASSPEELAAGLDRIARKYGWQYRLSRIRGSHADETVIELSDRA